MGARKRQVLVVFESDAFSRHWPVDKDLDTAPPFGRELADEVIRLLPSGLSPSCFEEGDGWGIHMRTRSAWLWLYVHFRIVSEQHRWAIQLTATRRWFGRDAEAAADFAELQGSLAGVLAEVRGVRDVRWYSEEETARLLEGA